jgi:hypothetical protein
LEGKLNSDDPIAEIPKDLSCIHRKKSNEELIEELVYHGQAMGNL